MKLDNRIINSVKLKLSAERLELDELLESYINRQTNIETKSEDIIRVLKEIATNEGASVIITNQLNLVDDN